MSTKHKPEDLQEASDFTSSLDFGAQKLPYNLDSLIGWAVWSVTSRSLNVLKPYQNLSAYRIRAGKGISLPKAPNQLAKPVPVEVGTIHVNFERVSNVRI